MRGQHGEHGAREVRGRWRKIRFVRARWLGTAQWRVEQVRAVGVGREERAQLGPLVARAVLVEPALVHVRAGPAAEDHGEGDRTVKRLTWRIALSLVLFLALWGAYQMGWIEPKSGPVDWHQTEQPPEPE